MSNNNIVSLSEISSVYYSISKDILQHVFSFNITQIHEVFNLITIEVKKDKLAEKQAKKNAKLAEKQAKKNAKLAEKEAKKNTKHAEKEAKLSKKKAKQNAKLAEKSAKLYKKEARKWRKDPNMPKGARNAFIIYCMEMRDTIKSKYPGKKMTDIQIIMGKQWSLFTSEEKATWFSKAVEDKDRANKEQTAYKNTLEHLSWNHRSYCKTYLASAALSLSECIKSAQNNTSSYDEYAAIIEDSITQHDAKIIDMLLEKTLFCKTTTQALEILYINISILKEIGLPCEELVLDTLSNLKYGTYLEQEIVSSRNHNSYKKEVQAIKEVYTFCINHDELDPETSFVQWMDEMRALAKLTKQIGNYLGNEELFESLQEVGLQIEEDKNNKIITKLQETVFSILCDDVSKEAAKGARQDQDFDKCKFSYLITYLADLLADNAPDHLIDEIDWSEYAELIAEKVIDLEVLDINNEISDKQIVVALRKMLVTEHYCLV